MGRSSFNFYKLNRRIHLYAGLFMLPYIFIFGVSGIMFNHPNFLTNRSVDSFSLEGEQSFSSLFPDSEALAQAVADSMVERGILTEPKRGEASYNRTMILRNKNEEADHRVQVDIPSGRVRMITLPDFANNPQVAEGQIAAGANVETETLTDQLERMLKSQGIEPGNSRVQRIPRLEFDVEQGNTTYRVSYNLTNGEYEVEDLGKRTFKLNYLLIRMHEQHGYPVGGLSIEWLWIFLADSLAFLMIIWAVSGMIMWIKMKKLRKIGIVLLSASFLVLLLILTQHYELEY